MNDLISREEAIIILEDYMNKGTFTLFKNAVKAMKAVPTAESERKKGKWIPVTSKFAVQEGRFPNTVLVWEDATEPDDIDGLKCSECGTVYDFTEARNWCSECGADMRGEEDGNN